MSEDDSEREAKRQRTEEKYRLFYWPGIPGRGEPVRLAFEEAGIDYEDVVYTEGGVNAVKALVQQGSRLNLEANHPPHFAPPILQHGDVQISQTPNIMVYLGPRLKLTPDDEVDRLRVNQLFLTMSDCQTEVHDTHHFLAVQKFYEEQKDAAFLKALDFREDRLPKFLAHFETALAYNSGGEFLVGDKLTYADLMLFHLIDGISYAFPRCVAHLSKHFTRVFKLHERVRTRPRIAAYLASPRRQKYSNGIYRHYDELDEPISNTVQSTMATEQSNEAAAVEDAREGELNE